MKTWPEALAEVSSIAQTWRESDGSNAILSAIADCVLRKTRADFVVFYEYFIESDEVSLPPIVAGALREPDVLSNRGIVTDHNNSSVFRLIQSEKSVYAENGLEDWERAGLSEKQTTRNPRSFFVREGVCSSIGFPLLSEGEPVGALFINYRQNRYFDTKFRAGFESLANQVALIIGSKRFHVRSVRYNQKVSTIIRVGNELGSAVPFDIRRIAAMLDELTQEQVPTKNFFLCLYDEDSNRFDLPYVRDQFDTRDSLEPQLSEGLTAYICRSGKDLLLSRRQQEIIFHRGEARLVGKPSAVWLGANLRIRGKVIGAIVVQDFEDELAFNQEHRQLLIAIAAQAAIAIENYRLLQGTRKQLRELGALLAISQRTANGDRGEPEELRSALDEICSLTEADGCLLLLVDPGDRAKIKVAAASTSLDSFVNRTVESGKGVAGQLLENHDLAESIQNSYDTWAHRLEMFDPPPKRVCAVPLLSRGDLIGVLTLASSSNRKSFGQQDIAILKRFAASISLAIQTSRDLVFRTALIDAGPHAMIAVDRTGRITDFNAEAANLFQYAPGELTNKNVVDIYEGGILEARRIQALLRKHSYTRDEETFGKTRTGAKIPLSLSASILADDGERIVGSVGIIEDLRLQALRTRTQLLIECLREISDKEDLNNITSLVLNSAMTLLYADSGCLYLLEDGAFGVAHSMGCRQDVEAMAAKASQCLLELASRERTRIWYPIEQELDVPRLREGSKSSVLVPVHTENKLLAYLLVESQQSGHFKGDPQLLRVMASQAAVSISRVLLLRYREKTLRGLMVAANAIAVGQIATTFIHEAGNSLNSMNLAVRSLYEDLEGEPSLRTKKVYLERLNAVAFEISRFAHLSRRLQRFTHQGLKPEKAEEYLNDIVTQTIQVLESTLRSKKIKLQLKLDSRLNRPSRGNGGNPVLVDAQQIQQVLMNLVLNAVAASGERKPISVTTSVIPGWIECSVEDYGSGIDSNAKGRLFEPFFTTKKDGVGLGLYLSKMLIEDNHSGTIEIKSSSPGKGSVLALRLPRVAT